MAPAASGNGGDGMIKYAEIDGYANCGEAAPFSHLYQFMENGKETPMTILIHGYDICPAKVFKGYVFNKTRTHSSASLTEDEKTVLQQYIGEIEQVGFSEFANSHEMLIPYREYVEQKEAQP
jgi:hypothetical protein